VAKACTSCNREVVKDYIEFPCPRCGKEKIIRCSQCKTLSKEYKCRNCEFIGP
jgi:predicted RNA-binding Zn-ribbon protein involved in translation (DUF1610 family)